MRYSFDEHGLAKIILETQDVVELITTGKVDQGAPVIVLENKEETRLILKIGLEPFGDKPWEKA